MTPTSSNRKEDSTPELNLNYFDRDDQSKFMIRDLNAAFYSCDQIYIQKVVTFIKPTFQYQDFFSRNQ